MLSIKKIQEIRASKKRKGFSFMEILVALIMVVSLSVGAFFTYSDAQQTRKMAQMHNDMDAIITGCLVYEALHVTSTLPDTLATLQTGITDDTMSVDGSIHENIVTSVRADGTNFKTPWNGDYAYDADARTLTCIPNNTNGDPMDPVVRRF